MGRRPLLAMALGWVLVVLAVATVTFVVVDRAGRGVGQASATRTVAPLPSVVASATSDLAPSASPGPSAAPATPAPGASPPPPGARTASFTTDGGTVVASCAGTTVTLGSITPRDGWRFEREAEHGGLEVKFSGGQGGDAEVEIVLACADGIPIRLDR